MSTHWDRRDTGERSNAFFYVIVLAVLVRFVYFISYLQSPCHGFRFADSVYYRQWAQRIAAGDWLGQGPFEQGPLYAYLLAAAFVVGLPEDLILVLQLLTGVATCALVYACGRQLFSPSVALTAAVITALYGPLVYHECTLMKSFLSPLLIMLTLYAGCGTRSPRRSGGFAWPAGWWDWPVFCERATCC
jgi:4-amino-4-deoxy-L-arabinose transferase-like glycosyltransferase